MGDDAKRLVLEKILDKDQISHILKEVIGEDVPWDLKGSEVRPAMDGIAGFLGDHMKALLHVDVQGVIKKVHLFLKCMPACKPKADFIKEKNFNMREKLMFSVLEEICQNGPKPFCAKAYIYTDSILVMPDLSHEGYTSRHYLETLDTNHIFVTATSIARFHAAFVNYETKKSINLKRAYNTFEEFGHLLTEATFVDSPWLKACSILSVNLLKKYSTKSYRNLPDLQSKLAKLHVKACESLKEYKDTLNILIHKDLWVNNIMFKYENDTPVNAVLVDYQCIRYAPPAFDIIAFLYLNTNRRFREEREKDVIDHYYSIFEDNLDDDSKKRLKSLHYDKNTFLNWCEEARMFGLMEAIGIYPFVLMDPKTAQKTFDDPTTFDKYVYEDRSEPVMAVADRCEMYRERNLEVNEEFIERYLLK
ncbi:uncharacterized protein LOC142978021 [Anticarsia gemmatalis]|uniref:uncharacterized protein LOC142978021 n=1 Tax=Anticarsia gemmatalis TaxID=129554 RepID=UPI003F76C76C